MCSNGGGGGKFNNPILGVRKFMLEIPWFLMTEYKEVCSKKVKVITQSRCFLISCCYHHWRPSEHGKQYCSLCSWQFFAPLRDEHHAKGFGQKIVACTSTTHLLAHQKWPTVPVILQGKYVLLIKLRKLSIQVG